MAYLILELIQKVKLSLSCSKQYFLVCVFWVWNNEFLKKVNVRLDLMLLTPWIVPFVTIESLNLLA